MWPAYCRPRRLFFGDVASVPVSEGVIPGNTYIYVYTNLYIHIHTNTIIYVNIHTYTYSLTWAGFLRQIYIHIHTYTCIYIHIPTIHTYTYISESRSRVFSRGCSRRPRAPGWTPTGQICCGAPWDWIIVRGSCIGDLRAKREGRFRGPGRVPRGGVRQLGCAQPLPTAE